MLCSHFGHLSYCYLSKSSKQCVYSLTSGINGPFSLRELLLTGYFLFVWVMRDYSDQSVHLSKSLRSHFYHLLMLRFNFSRSPKCFELLPREIFVLTRRRGCMPSAFTGNRWCQLFVIDPSRSNM